MNPTPYEEWIESMMKKGPPPDRSNPHCDECLGTTEHIDCPLSDITDIIYCRRRVYGLSVFDKLYAWYVGQFRKVR